jgi:hypothetical protein
MAYTPVYSTWLNWPTTTTPITAAVMQGVDDFIDDIANGDDGDNVLFYQAASADSTGQLLHVAKGTSGSPNTVTSPVLKVARTMEVSSSGFDGDGVEPCSAILGVGSGTASNDGQVVGVAGLAKSASTTVASSGGDDACGLYGVGRITGSGTGTGIGAFVAGRRDTDTAKVSAIEIACANYTATAGTYNTSGFSNTQGIWMNAVGDSDSAAGMVVGNAFGRQFKVGIGFTGQVTGGKTGGAADASIRDDGNATTVFDVNGSHTNILDTQGATISGQLFKITTPGTYTPTNVVTDRAFNANSTTTDELADVLGTLIADLQTLGLIA